MRPQKWNYCPLMSTWHRHNAGIVQKHMGCQNKGKFYKNVYILKKKKMEWKFDNYNIFDMERWQACKHDRSTFRFVKDHIKRYTISAAISGICCPHFWKRGFKRCWNHGPPLFIGANFQTTKQSCSVLAKMLILKCITKGSCSQWTHLPIITHLNLQLNNAFNIYIVSWQFIKNGVNACGNL